MISFFRLGKLWSDGFGPGLGCATREIAASLEALLAPFKRLVVNSICSVFAVLPMEA